MVKLADCDGGPDQKSPLTMEYTDASKCRLKSTAHALGYALRTGTRPSTPCEMKPVKETYNGTYNAALLEVKLDGYMCVCVDYNSLTCVLK